MRIIEGERGSGATKHCCSVIIQFRGRLEQLESYRGWPNKVARRKEIRGIGQGRGYWCALIPYFETRSVYKAIAIGVAGWLMVMMLLCGGIVLIKVEAGDKGAVTRSDW